MTDKTTEALKLAEALENDAKEHREVSYGLDCPPERTANWKHALNCEAAARLIHEALAEPEPLTMRLDIEASKVKTMTLEEYKEFMQPVKQEPVGFLVHHGELCYKSDDVDQSYGMWCPVTPDYQPPFSDGTMFYAAPVSAKREWVDLTDDEIGAVMDFGYATDSELENARDVITAFKEKNK